MYATIRNLPKLPRYYQWWGRPDSTGLPPIRVRVPVAPALRASFGGKTELVAGLGGCRNPRDAEKMGRAIIVGFEAKIEAARLGGDPGATAQRLIAWGSEQDSPLIQQTREPVGREIARNLVAHGAAVLAMKYGGPEFALPEDQRDAIGALIGEHFDNRHSHLGRVNTLLDELKAALLRVPDQDFGQAADGALASVAAAEAMPLAGFTWEAGIELWITSHGEFAPTDESVDVYRSHCRRFFAWLGHSDMGRVTALNIADYPNVLLTGADGGKPVGRNKTINNHMSSIRAVFRVAAAKRKIATDPTIGTVHKLKVRKNESRDRAGFDRDQHASIVREALRLRADDPRRWLWLLGCAYGGRIGEFADATVSAVQERFGMDVFNINPEYRCWHVTRAGKRVRIPLKTEGSPRILPLHDGLVAAGFIAYVESVRAANPGNPDAPLFPMLSLDRYGKRSHRASDICGEWLREIVGIKDPRNVFHSTRHVIKTFLRGRVDSDQVHDAITGHDDGKVSAHYGETELTVIRDALRHIPLAV